MKVVIGNPSFAAQVSKSLKGMTDGAKKRMRKAADVASDLILLNGRDDIRSAGKFGSRWTEGLTAEVTNDEERVVITVQHAVPYWTVFQYGKLIKGQPLLWIPMGPNEGSGISAKDFPGRLFRVNRKSGGAPLLLSAGKPAQVQYHGQTSVYIPKKFHLREICRDVAGRMGALYRRTPASG